MINNLSILYDIYLKQATKVKELSSIMDVHYSITSVIESKLALNVSTPRTREETTRFYGEIKAREYKDKVRYDCELIKFQMTTKQLIEELKVFHDATKEELSSEQYNRIKKLVDDTLLATKTRAQKES